MNRTPEARWAQRNADGEALRHAPVGQPGIPRWLPLIAITDAFERQQWIAVPPAGWRFVARAMWGGGTIYAPWWCAWYARLELALVKWLIIEPMRWMARHRILAGEEGSYLHELRLAPPWRWR